jgi:hypothetical protein
LVGSGDEQRRGQNVTRHRIKTNLLAETVVKSLLAFPIIEILELVQDWEEVRLLGEFACEQGIVRYAVRDANGAILRETQRLVRLLRRQPDGEWRVLRAMWHAPRRASEKTDEKGKLKDSNTR